MNTNMKDRIKLSMAISILLIIIIAVIFIVIQYQVEGEKNMPYQLSKIMVISTAKGEPNTENPGETSNWNLFVNQNNVIYFFIDKKSAKEDEFIQNVVIDNIQVTKEPTKGTVKAFMPSSTSEIPFEYDEQYVINDKLEYKGGKSSNSQTLEICNQGGSAILILSNTKVGNFISNEETDVKHDGTLLKKIETTDEEIKFQVKFDLTIQINKIKYKANIALKLPCDNLSEEGRTTREITDMSNIVFKRVK